MKKIVFGLLFLFFMLLPKEIFAADFLVSSEVTYQISEDSGAHVTHNIAITNAKTEVHATDYTLTLSAASPRDIRAHDALADFETVVTESEGTIYIKVIFPEAVVGQGKTQEFTIEYNDSSIARQNGDVHEINIPRLANQNVFENYRVRLLVPNTFGDAAYMSPAPDNKLAGKTVTTYYFNESALNRAGVTAAFGSSQTYSFDITYHLQNPLAIPTKMEIAVPPDTAYQKVAYSLLSPAPVNVYRDADGNWLARYNLQARERLDIRALGAAQVFASPVRSVTLSDEAREKNLRPTSLWQVDNPELLALGKSLATPRAIYDFVVSTLSYDYEKVTLGTKRLGALEALKNPKEAICTEFTDTFIALARAAGIPAREVNGFAYTDNKTLQPLSLVADVLHAWPEYWDDEKSAWVPVDPTWGHTTGGIDYFSKLDLKHLAFVMHGESVDSPIPPGSYKLGANPQKDVFISLAENFVQNSQKPDIKLSQKHTVPFAGIKLAVNISNKTGSALYDQKVELFFDKRPHYERDLPVLLPYESRTLEFSIPYGVLGRNTPDEVVAVSGGEKFTYKPDKKPPVIRDLVSAGFIIIVLILVGFLVMRRKKR